MRFFSAIREFSRLQLARLTQIDYDREMALLLVNSRQEIMAIGRLCTDSGRIEAEFALLVRSDLKRRGLGSAMMAHLIGYARLRGFQRIYGDVLAENEAMRGLCKKYDFKLSSTTTAGILRSSLKIQDYVQGSVDNAA